MQTSLPLGPRATPVQETKTSPRRLKRPVDAAAKGRLPWQSRARCEPSAISIGSVGALRSAIALTD